jgi:hypothetical protein
MKKLALAICLFASVAALSACETAQSSETTTHGSRVMEKSVTK